MQFYGSPFHHERTTGIKVWIQHKDTAGDAGLMKHIMCTKWTANSTVQRRTCWWSYTNGIDIPKNIG